MVYTDSQDSDRLVLSLHLPFVSKVEQGKGGSGRHQEGDVEPPVVEVELARGGGEKEERRRRRGGGEKEERRRKGGGKKEYRAARASSPRS